MFALTITRFPPIYIYIYIYDVRSKCSKIQSEWRTIGEHFYKWHLGDEQFVRKMDTRNTDARLQAEKGWYFQDIFDSPSLSQWVFGSPNAV